MKELLQVASNNIGTLNELKNLAVKLGQYELGAECRRLEKELFPITPEEEAAKKKAETLQTLFAMVELNIQDKEVCYRISQVLDLYRKKKGKFDLKDAANILVESKKLFCR